MKLIRNARGFSLVEMLIVVIILGILMAIAVPGYGEYVRKGNRSAAKQFLLMIANKQEQYLLDTRTYASTIATLSLTEPPDLAGKYTFSITDHSDAPPAYKAVASPVAGGPQDGDGDLTITQTGAKTGKW